MKCAQCDTEFLPFRPHYRYCSVDCWQASKAGAQPASQNDTPAPAPQPIRSDDAHAWVDEVIEKVPPEAIWPPLEEQVDYKASLGKQP